MLKGRCYTLANRHTIAQAKYDAANTRRFTLKYNRKNDADVIAQLEKQPSPPAYIKSLIRKDIAENGKKWYLIEDCTKAKAQVFETELKVRTAQEAQEKALAIWNGLSAYDQKEREACYIGLAGVDDDGCIDYNSMTDIFTIK